jgi:type VI secretion system protein ImpM
MSDPLPGWYGKIASLGDFAHRRLSAEWIAVCDAWLSDALRGAEAALVPHWLEVYLTAPILRFAWSPGIVDRQWWLGVLMPSCDSVGRYFPLVIARSRSHFPTDRVGLDLLERWYDDASSIALATLGGTRESLDRMEAAIERLPPWPPAGGVRTVAFNPSEDGESDSQSSSGLLVLFRHSANAGFEESRIGRSAWWTVHHTRGCSRIEMVDGLPSGARFATLLQSVPGDQDSATAH